MDLGYLAAVVVLGGIILFHEFGHYLLAQVKRDCRGGVLGGIRTETSLMGEPKDRNRYSLKLLPLGGSCAMLGEFGEG